MRCIIAIFASIFLASCSDDAELPVSDPAFDTFLEKFVKEGHKRGYALDLDSNSIVFQFAELPDLKTGSCLPEKQPRSIFINPKYWEKASEWEREAVVFHELGHCILGRLHRNDTLPNGECASLMDGKENGFACINNLICPRWRDYYYEELFDPSTPLPGWYPSPEVATSFPKFLNAPLKLLPKRGYGVVRDFGKIEPDQDFLLSAVYPLPMDKQKYYGILWNDLGFFYNLADGIISIQLNSLARQLSTEFYRKKLEKVPGKLRLTLQGDGLNLRFWLNDQLLHSISRAYEKDSIYWKRIRTYNSGDDHLSVFHWQHVPCWVEFYSDEMDGKDNFR